MSNGKKVLWERLACFVFEATQMEKDLAKTLENMITHFDTLSFKMSYDKLFIVVTYSA